MTGRHFLRVDIAKLARAFGARLLALCLTII